MGREAEVPGAELARGVPRHAECAPRCFLPPQRHPTRRASHRCSSTFTEVSKNPGRERPAATRTTAPKKFGRSPVSRGASVIIIIIITSIAASPASSASSAASSSSAAASASAPDPAPSSPSPASYSLLRFAHPEGIPKP